MALARNDWYESENQNPGVALIQRLLVEDELARGLLVPERRQENPLLLDFKAWLEAEAIAYREPRGLGPPT